MKTRHWDRLGNGGLTFTELGFGSAPLGNLFRAISEVEAQAILAAAWDGGVRHFDTAPLYGLGLAETRLNPFLRGRDRDSLVLSTKIGRLFRVTHPQPRPHVISCHAWNPLPLPTHSGTHTLYAAAAFLAPPPPPPDSSP